MSSQQSTNPFKVAAKPNARIVKGTKVLNKQPTLNGDAKAKIEEVKPPPLVVS